MSMRRRWQLEHRRGPAGDTWTLRLHRFDDDQQAWIPTETWGSLTGGVLYGSPDLDERLAEWIRDLDHTQGRDPGHPDSLAVRLERLFRTRRRT